MLLKCPYPVSETAKNFDRQNQKCKSLSIFFFSLRSYLLRICTLKPSTSRTPNVNVKNRRKNGGFFYSSQFFQHRIFGRAIFCQETRARVRMSAISTNRTSYDFSMLPKPKISLNGSHFESLEYTQSNVTGILKTSGV
jgi:hypothetical protein